MKLIKKIIIAILIFFFIIFTILFIEESILSYNHSKHIVKGYVDKETFEKYDTFQALFEFKKYYYNSSYEEEYNNLTEYKQIGDDEEKIKEYVKAILEGWNKQSLIDVDKTITEDDYFYLIDDSNVYYINNSKHSDYNIDLYIYDNEENILYYIRNDF